MNKIMNVLVSRVFILVVSVLVQLAFVMLILYYLSASIWQVYICLYILSLIIVLYVINKRENPSYTIIWVLLILGVPIFGGVFYLMFGGRKIPKELQRHAMMNDEERLPFLKQNEDILKDIKDPTILKQVNYIFNHGYYPIYKNTKTKYYPVGEAGFTKMVKEISLAKKYIFLEYFIIEEGKMWDTIHAILVEKVKQGVDVRVLYDDAGCVSTLPRNYNKTLESEGIKCKVFNPLVAELAIKMNNRDHRKILVVDGEVAFTGGINLADEYINKKKRNGHWKDNCLYVKGAAVWSFTLMFLQFWNFEESNPEKYLDYKLEDAHISTFSSDGFVQPFSDSPTDDENVGETAHINLITQAKKYIYITTPYLIVGYDMIRALSVAAKNGVDVRITTPHIPDKWYVHMVTRSNYEELIKNGVRIYEYLPGFVHAKTLVADDEVAILGTVNMDFRSYYMHFECGVFMYQTSSVMKIKEDFLKTLNNCTEITYQECLDVPVFVRLMRAIMNIFSPFM